MPKVSTQYVCQSCGASSRKWAGRCDACGSWNSLVEMAAPIAGANRTGAKAFTPDSLAELSSNDVKRFTSGLAELDQVLGGGVVPGAIMLLSGDPGVGKSTLVLQVAAAVSSKSSTLYVSGEESVQQLKLRAERLGVGKSGIVVAAQTDADAIAQAIAEGGYGLVIIDSIQTISTSALSGSPGTVGQITASAQIIAAAAKASHTAVIIIGHVTKEGTIAGPKILEHLVDVVLYLEGERYGVFKALRGVKNRFGSTNEVGIFEMNEKGLVAVANPSQALLAERQLGPGSVVLPTMEGTRPLLVEVQALVAPSVFGYPKRTAVGFDLNRLSLLLAVMNKRAGLNLNTQDVYVNVVGGLRASEPASDLAIILSIASASKNQAIPDNMVVFGEVGLSGEIRSVGSTDRRLAEAQRLGFTAALAPKANAKSSGMLAATDVASALKLAFSSSQ